MVWCCIIRLVRWFLAWWYYYCIWMDIRLQLPFLWNFLSLQHHSTVKHGAWRLRSWQIAPRFLQKYTPEVLDRTWKSWFPKGISFSRAQAAIFMFHVKLQGCIWENCCCYQIRHETCARRYEAGAWTLKSRFFYRLDNYDDFAVEKQDKHGGYHS